MSITSIIPAFGIVFVVVLVAAKLWGTTGHVVVRGIIIALSLVAAVHIFAAAVQAPWFGTSPGESLVIAGFAGFAAAGTWVALKRWPEAQTSDGYRN